MNTWAIIDDNGVIDEQSEDAIRDLWWAYRNRPETMPTWTGDLKLVEIHEVTR